MHTPSPLPQNLLTPRNGTHVINHVNNNLNKDYDTHNLLNTFFSRRSAQRLRAGSVVSVMSYADASRTTVAPFSGVLMRVRRRGVDTSFTLRNIVQKTGVEMNFKINSPMIKEVTVVRRARGKKGAIQDLRRARANFLREKPAVMTQIAAALKQASQERLAKKALESKA